MSGRETARLYRHEVLDRGGVAQDALVALDELATRLGRPVHQTDFVEEARTNTSSPLRRYLEWDADEGLLRWQLEQARQVLKRITYRIISPDDAIVKVRHNLSVKRDETSEREYVDVVEALRGRDRDLLMTQAKKDLDAVATKYRNLLDFEQVIEEWLESWRSKRRRAS